MLLYHACVKYEESHPKLVLCAVGGDPAWPVSVFSIAKGKSYSGLLRKRDGRSLPPPTASFLCHGFQHSPVWRFGFSGIIWSLEGVVRRKMNPKSIYALIPMTCGRMLHYMVQGTFWVSLKTLKWEITCIAQMGPMSSQRPYMRKTRRVRIRETDVTTKAEREMGSC